MSSGKREDFRKQRELDEARKAGTAPAEVDEDGKDINPHIPQYVSRTPWYLGLDKPTLKHQRQDPDKIEQVTPLDEWIRYKKGVNKSAPKAKKYRKGACENCGAMTHKTRDCVERPRKLGAKYTNKDIKPDEHLPNLEEKINYDGKHDRWRGYNPAEYQRVIEQHRKIEEEKRKVREKQLREEKFQKADAKEAKAKGEGDDSDSSSDEEDEQDEAKYADSANMIQKFDTKNRVSVRNLRIREDTAKYLRNLDVSSAHYDPKTRTMRGNPYEHTGLDKKDVPFAGDNFVRYTGDVVKVAEKQLFAWDATGKGESLHAQADPTLAEVMFKRHQDKKVNFKETQQQSVLDKYGGAEHMDAPPKELLMAQSEHYVEYSKLGRVIKGQDKAIARSKYLEDQHPGNHTSVWGSFWKAGKWGYACCHSLVRESYCVGEKGIAVEANSDKMFAIKESSATATEAEGGVTAEDDQLAENEPPKSMVQLHQERMAKEANGGSDCAPEEEDSDAERRRRKKEKKKRKKERKERKRKGERDEDGGSDDEESARKKRIKEAMAKQALEEAAADKLLKQDERSRSYGAIAGGVDEPTEEEMEAWRLRQGRKDDPMNAFM